VDRQFDPTPWELWAEISFLGSPSRRPRGRSRGPRDRSRGPRDRSLGSRDRSGGPRDQSWGHRDRYRGPRDQSRGPRDRSRGPRDQSRGLRDRSRGPRDGPGVKKSNSHAVLADARKPSGLDSGQIQNASDLQSGSHSWHRSWGPRDRSDRDPSLAFLDPVTCVGYSKLRGVPGHGL